MNKPRIGNLLVVDDEIDTLNPLCDLFTEWGYGVKGLTSGKEALEAIREEDFDVLLADLVMPEIDGIELIKAAMEIDPLLVCIVVTGQGSIQTAVEAMKVGAFDFLIKPLDFKILRPILSRAVEVQRLRLSEAKYRSIVEDQTELICRWKPGEILTFVNEVYCRYFNTKAEELIGKSFMTLIPEEEREDVRRHFASISANNPVSTHEHRVIKHDGEIRWHQWTNRALFDEESNIIEYQSVGCDINERKMAEEALRKSEAKYHDLYDNAPDMYHTLNENGVIIDCNKTEAKTLGYEKREILGKHVTYFFTEKSKRLFESSFAQLKQFGTLQNIEREFIRRDGTTFPAILNVFAKYDEAAKFTGSKAISRDITQLRQIQDALRRNEHQIRMITDNIPALVSYIDLHGRYEFVNARYEEWVGISRSEIIGKHVREVLGDEAYNRIEEYIKQASSGYPVSFENNIPYLRGGTRWVNVQYIPDIEEEGKVKGFYALVIDITERKQAEEKLRDSEEKYRLLFEAESDAILVLDAETKRFIDANDAALKISGYSHEEFMRLHLSDITAEPEESEKNLQNILAGKSTKVPLRYYRKKDGTIFPVEISAAMFTLRGRKILIGAVRDITERKQKEEQLKKSHKQLRNLAARLSEVEEAERRQIAQELHDQVGQNLTALGINLNIIRSQISKRSLKLVDFRFKDSLELLEKTTESIRNVMADLRPSVLDDYGLPAGIRWYAEKFSARTNIAVKIHGKELTHRLPASVETTMFRITQEALTNVAKHSQAKKIIISLKEIDYKVRLSIADDGIGFDPKTVYKTKEEMVWGLHSMQERTEALGGTFTVQSKPGKGTKIIVEIKR